MRRMFCVKVLVSACILGENCKYNGKNNRNRLAINLLKNDKYLQENKLIIEPIWVNYWKNFDYDNLYPFCLEIEECKNGLIKNQSGLDKQRSI